MIMLRKIRINLAVLFFVAVTVLWCCGVISAHLSAHIPFSWHLSGECRCSQYGYLAVIYEYAHDDESYYGFGLRVASGYLVALTHGYSLIRLSQEIPPSCSSNHPCYCSCHHSNLRYLYAVVGITANVHAL